MKTQSPSMFACLVVVAACLAWVGGISWAITYFLGLSVMAGWCIAGSLGFSSTVAMTMILYEMRHAVDYDDQVESVDMETPPAANLWGASLGTSPVVKHIAPSFQVPKEFY